MAYSDILHADVWTRFFQDAPADQHTILMHSVDAITASVLPSCQMIPTQPTAWGGFSLVRVQQALFETACKDPDVVKCILLSSDSAPLYSFRYLYDKLCSDDKGYMYYSTENKCDPKYLLERGLSMAAWPTGRPCKYSKTYQWCILNRMHVETLTREFGMIAAVFGKAIIPDEHVYSMVFESLGLLNTFHLQLVCWIQWKGDAHRCPERLTHREKPLTYHTSNFTPAFVASIYSDNSFFMRKLCSTAVLTIDWSQNKLIRASPDGNDRALLKKRPFLRFGGRT